MKWINDKIHLKRMIHSQILIFFHETHKNNEDIQQKMYFLGFMDKVSKHYWNYHFTPQFSIARVPTKKIQLSPLNVDQNRSQGSQA